MVSFRAQSFEIYNLQSNFTDNQDANLLAHLEQISFTASDKSQPGKRVALPAVGPTETVPLTGVKQTPTPMSHAVPSTLNVGRSQQQQLQQQHLSPNHGRRGQAVTGGANIVGTGINGEQGAQMAQFAVNMQHKHHRTQPSSVTKRSSPTKITPSSPSSTSSSSSLASAPPSPSASYTVSASPANMMLTSRSKQLSSVANGSSPKAAGAKKAADDSLRYEYDDHYFLTDPDEFIYEFYPLSPEWQLIKARPITLVEFEQLPFIRSLFFKYGLYFPQPDIRSVLHTDTSGATTIKIGMPTHMIPSLIFHYNLKYYDSDLEHYEGVSLKRFVMQSVESG